MSRRSKNWDFYIVFRRELSSQLENRVKIKTRLEKSQTMTFTTSPHHQCDGYLSLLLFLCNILFHFTVVGTRRHSVFLFDLYANKNAKQTFFMHPYLVPVKSNYFKVFIHCNTL